MERTELTRIKQLFGNNLIGPAELLSQSVSQSGLAHAVSQWGLALAVRSAEPKASDLTEGPGPSVTPSANTSANDLRLSIPPLNYSWDYLEQHAQDYLLILGQSSINGVDITLRNLRTIFGIDPAQSEPCFYNQDWYLNETFIDTKLEDRWYLLKKDVFETSRAVMPQELLEKEISFPSAILCAYTFFAYYLHYNEPLWYHDFIWCSDVDHNGDRIYVGKYHDIDGVNKNGFSIHRHLALRPCYAAVDAL